MRSNLRAKGPAEMGSGKALKSGTLMRRGGTSDSLLEGPLCQIFLHCVKRADIPMGHQKGDNPGQEMVRHPL